MPSTQGRSVVHELQGNVPYSYDHSSPSGHPAETPNSRSRTAGRANLSPLIARTCRRNVVRMPAAQSVRAHEAYIVTASGLPSIRPATTSVLGLERGPARPGSV